MWSQFIDHLSYVSPFGWRSWGTEKLSKWLKVTQLASGRFGIQVQQSDSVCLYYQSVSSTDSKPWETRGLNILCKYVLLEKKIFLTFLLTFSTDDFAQGKVKASVTFSVTLKKMYVFLSCSRNVWGSVSLICNYELGYSSGTGIELGQVHLVGGLLIPEGSEW